MTKRSQNLRGFEISVFRVEICDFRAVSVSRCYRAGCVLLL